MSETQEPGSTFLLGRGGGSSLYNSSRRAALATPELRCDGVNTRVVRLDFVPEDETRFYVFAGRITADLAKTFRRAGIVFGLIVPGDKPWRRTAVDRKECA